MDDSLSAQHWAAVAGRYCVLVERGLVVDDAEPRGLCAAATFHYHSSDTKQPSDQSLRAFSWIRLRAGVFIFRKAFSYYSNFICDEGLWMHSSISHESPNYLKCVYFNSIQKFKSVKSCRYIYFYVFFSAVVVQHFQDTMVMMMMMMAEQPSLPPRLCWSQGGRSVMGSSLRWENHPGCCRRTEWLTPG